MTLRTEGIKKEFSGLTAVDDVSISIENEITGIMGPNGSGKSTFINCITNIIPPTAGEVFHNGENITGKKTYQIARHGIGRTFQTPQIFDELSVLENVMIPLLPTDRETEVIQTIAQEKIEFVELTDVITKDGRDLSGGQKKLLEFARNLMREPDIVLMDEPFAGVHPRIKGKMHDQINQLHREGVDFLIISHEVESLHSICDRIVVFDRGSAIADDSPEKISTNDKVIEAYLGS